MAASTSADDGDAVMYGAPLMAHNHDDTGPCWLLRYLSQSVEKTVMFANCSAATKRNLVPIREGSIDARMSLASASRFAPNRLPHVNRFWVPRKNESGPVEPVTKSNARSDEAFITIIDDEFSVTEPSATPVTGNVNCVGLVTVTV